MMGLPPGGEVRRARTVMAVIGGPPLPAAPPAPGPDAPHPARAVKAKAISPKRVDLVKGCSWSMDGPTAGPPLGARPPGILPRSAGAHRVTFLTRRIGGQRAPNSARAGTP